MQVRTNFNIYSLNPRSNNCCNEYYMTWLESFNSPRNFREIILRLGLHFARLYFLPCEISTLFVMQTGQLVNYELLTISVYWLLKLNT